LGTVLKSECRESDIVARIGPARLAVLCPELSVGESEQQRVVPKELGLRWHKKTELASFKVGDVPQKIQLRIGGVSYQRPSVLGAKGVMHEAELALQVARRENEDYYLVR
jgi:GGDEF domain-containing protein